MAAGITARQYTNNAVFTEGTKLIQIPANIPAGSADDLIAQAIAGMGGSLPSAILLSNATAGTIYIKPEILKDAANTGAGLPISTNGSMFFPLTGVPTDGIYLENAGVCYAICFE